MATKKRSKKASRAPRRARATAASLKVHCRSLPGTTEDIKWGDDLIFSVGGKMYAGFNVEGEAAFAFKCSEDEFMRLIQITGVIPAPYMAKAHWVKVEDRKVLPDTEWKGLLTRAHRLIADKLSARARRELGLE